MATVITMPKLGLTMTKATITRWLKKEGEKVNKGEVLVEFETDKINTEYESTEDGYLLKILVNEGQEADVSAPICILGCKEDININLSEIIPQDKITLNNNKNHILNSSDIGIKRIFISPLAKKIAKEKGIDYSKINGSGTNGRIIKKDIENAIRNLNRLENFEASSNDNSWQILQANAQEDKIPLSNIRKISAQRLTQSKKEIPHAYFKIHADMSKAVSLKENISKDIEKITGAKLTFTHMILKAVSLAIEQNPYINVSLLQDSIFKHKDINIGVAVDTEQGLIVPVIKHINKKTLGQICLELKNYTDKAHNGKLTVEEISGGTFTVSNLGMYGIDEFNAIIKPPESAILAVGAITECAIPENGVLTIKPLVNLVLSVDHRVIDGALAARFMRSIKSFLENPYVLLAI